MAVRHAISLHRALIGGLLTASFFGCGPAEIRIDNNQGVPPVTGSVTIDLSMANCGQPFTSGMITVQTKKTTSGCELTFDQDQTILKDSDYTNIPALNGATNLLQRVELTIKKLAFADADTNQTLDVATRVTSATLSVNGQQIADKSIVSSLPKTVTLSGAALNTVKSAVDARKAVTVRATCVAEVPDSPAPPKKLKIDYDAQPAIIVGPGQITLPK